MIKISDLLDLEVCSNVTTQIANQIDSFLYPLNDSFAYNFVIKNYAELRKNTLNYSDCILSLEQKKSSLLFFDILPFKTSSFPFYFYVGSKKNLYEKHLFEIFLPSAYDVFFDFCVKENKIFVLPNRFSSFIFFSEQFFEPFTINNLLNQSFEDSFSQFIKLNKLIEKDNDYLILKIQEKNQIILNLQEENISLHRKNYITSQMTWR